MAKELNQIVTQVNEKLTQKRAIIQFTEDGVGETQIIKNYADMTTEEKAIFDTYVQMCEVLMNNG